jgi:cytoskeleton protein RodZ
MSAFGENLRREREMRGVSLEEISSATKISMRFLDAIEREDFSKLPGGIFSRSFIRNYARYLGLDEEQVVNEYQLAAKPQVDFDLHRMVAESSSSRRPTSRTPLIATVVAVILLAGGYVLFRYAPRATEAPVTSPPTSVPTTPTPAAPVAAPSPAAPGTSTAASGASSASSPGAQGAAPATPAPAPSNAPAAPGANPSSGPTVAAGGAGPSRPATGNVSGANPAADADLVLQLAATERAWVAVDADGKTVLQRVLNPDEVQTLRAHKAFEVTTGNAQAVILTLNGETLKPLGRRGEVKTVRLTRDDLKPPAP